VSHEWDPDRHDYGDTTDAYHWMAQADEAERQAELALERAERLSEHRPVRPDPKPQRRVTRRAASDPEASRAWREAVLDRDQGCCYHSNPAICSGGFESHHVVYAKRLREYHPAALWNPLSGMGLCGFAHAAHHDGTSFRIPQSAIPASVTAYLIGLGYRRFLDQYYDIGWLA